VSATSWTRSELLDNLTRAISETRVLIENARAGKKALEDVLWQLESVETWLQTRETLDDAARKSLSFDIIAIRELDCAGDPHLDYINLVCDLATHLEHKPGA